MKRLNTFIILLLATTFLTGMHNKLAYAQLYDEDYNLENDAPLTDYVDPTYVADDQVNNQEDVPVDDNSLDSPNDQDVATDGNVPSTEDTKDQELFGVNQDEGFTEPLEELEPTHTVLLDLVFTILVKNTLTYTEDLEINYHAKMETDVNLSARSHKNEGVLETTVDVYGLLSGADNELYDCVLEIEVPNQKVEITTRYVDPSQTLNNVGLSKLDTNNDGEVQEEEEIDQTPQLSIRTKIDTKSIAEDYYANCNATDGTESKMRTKGPTENYLGLVLETLQPDILTGTQVDYYIDEDDTIYLTGEPLLVEDLDLFEQYYITIDPDESKLEVIVKE